jgi:hypothetical protein
MRLPKNVYKMKQLPAMDMRQPGAQNRRPIKTPKTPEKMQPIGMVVAEYPDRKSSFIQPDKRGYRDAKRQPG